MRKISICFVCSLCIAVSVFAAPSVIYGPTTVHDTLWSIATKLQPSSDVSVQQVMLALLKQNRPAFYCNNVNALEPRKKLTLPSVDVITSTSKSKAYLEVVKQNKQWHRPSKKTPTKLKRLAKAKHHKSIISAQSKQQLTVVEAVKSSTEIQAAIIQPKVAQVVIAQSANNQQEVVPSVMVDQQGAKQPTVTQATPIAVTSNTSLEQEASLPVDISNSLTAIEAKNNGIQSQVTYLGERISSIEQDIKQLKERNLNLENKVALFNKFLNVLKRVNQYIYNPVSVVISAFVAVLVLLVVIYWIYGWVHSLVVGRRNRNVFKSPLNNQNIIHSSDKEEYNLTEGKEGVRVKLNLARAYIDMGKANEAQSILFEVLANSNPAEQAEAKELLDKVTKQAD